MKTLKYEVKLYGDLVGWLFQRGDFTWFEFSIQYTEDPNRAILGLRFEEELSSESSAHMMLHPWFSNLLPEGVLRNWVADYGNFSPHREMELLAQVGLDLPGAVQVSLEGENEATPIPENIKSGSIIEADELPPWRFSLAGVGFKLSLLRVGQRFTAPAYGRGGDWIIKLPDPEFSNVPTNEHAMMSLAKNIGISVPEILLINRGELPEIPDQIWRGQEEVAFAIKRFDRNSNRDSIHIEDLAQVKSVYARDKYQGSFETIAGLIYRGIDTESLEEFVRRLTLFVLIGNGDAHLKNWSFIYRNKRNPTLSPAYDIVATDPYRPELTPQNLGMKFGGTRRFDQVRIDMFDRLADILKCPTDLAAVSDQAITNVVEQWQGIADQLDAIPHVRKSIDESIQARSVTLRQQRQPKDQ